MALAPAKPKRALALRRADAPNYRDFSTPHDGDYVRYVDGLMLWAEQEQERMRLKALGDKARSTTDSQWGRTGSSPSAASYGSSSQPAHATHSTGAQPGSVDSALDGWKRKAKAQLAQVQQQAQSVAKAGKLPKAPALSKAGGLFTLLILVGLVLAGIFAPSLIPVMIIAVVVVNVIRAVRAASSSGKP